MAEAHSNQTDDSEPKPKPTVTVPQTVLVIGATGVTGRYVVAELLLCPEIASVRVVSRRKYEIPREYANSVIVSNAAQEGKLVEHIVDLEKVSEEELRHMFEGVHTFFNCFGSTRSKAGSKERFVQIDMNIPVRFAHIAREKGVRHTSLLTSSGANDKSVVLYFKVKGLIEASFRNLEFPALSIFRPGLLGRKEQMKFVEKMYSFIQTPIQTDDLARAIVQDCLSVNRRENVPTNPTYNNPQILALNAQRLNEQQQPTTVIPSECTDPILSGDPGNGDQSETGPIEKNESADSPNSVEIDSSKENQTETGPIEKNESADSPNSVEIDSSKENQTETGPIEKNESADSPNNVENDSSKENQADNKPTAEQDLCPASSETQDNL